MAIFNFARRVRKIALYSDLIHIRLEISRRTRWWCLKCVIVYLAGAIQAFVMYCVNGTSRSSLLIESTDSMIESTDSMITHSTQSIVHAAVHVVRILCSFWWLSDWGSYSPLSTGVFTVREFFCWLTDRVRTL